MVLATSGSKCLGHREAKEFATLGSKRAHDLRKTSDGVPRSEELATSRIKGGHNLENRELSTSGSRGDRNLEKQMAIL